MLDDTFFNSDDPKVTIESSYESIKSAGVYHWKKTAEHILGFSRCVKVLDEKCATEKGGSEFGRRAHDFWNLNHDQASKYLSIGKRYEYFNKIIKVLPAKYTTIAKLTKLTDEELTDLANRKKIHTGLIGMGAKSLIEQQLLKRERLSEDTLSDFDAEAFAQFFDKIYTQLPEDMKYDLGNKERSQEHWASIDILKRHRPEIEEELDNLKGPGAKKAVQFLLNVFFHIDDYGKACIEEGITENQKQKELDLNAREEEIAAKKSEIDEVITKLPYYGMKKEHVKFIRKQLDPKYCDADPDKAKEVLSAFDKVFTQDGKPPRLEGAPPW